MKIEDLQKKRVAITILARDCEEQLLKNIPLVEKLREYFFESYVVVVENDSIDNTKKVLNNWTLKSPNVIVLTEDNKSITILPQLGMINTFRSVYRIEKMSCYRNIYLDCLSSMNVDFDYVIMIDIDIKWFSVDGIITALVESIDNFGAIFANGYTNFRLGKFAFGKLPYDVYAFVGKGVLIEKVKKNSHEMNLVQKKLFVLNIFRNRIIVNSAFGGIGIYNWKAIRGRRYCVIQNYNNFDCQALCEHIPFNIGIVNDNYLNYIDNRILVNYGVHKIGITLFFVFPFKIMRFLYSLYRKK